MPGRRLRSVLEPVLYLGIAVLVHSALFLIPAGAPREKEVVTTQRGLRVKAFIERPAPPLSASSPTEISKMQPKPKPAIPTAPEQPQVSQEKSYSVMGSKTANGESPIANSQSGGARGTGAANVEGGGGAGGAKSAASRAQDGSPPQTEFGKYLASIKSSNVQGWAKDSALKSRQGWKGTGNATGAGAGDAGEGWGAGAGAGAGGPGAGRGAGGSGTGKSGTGRGGNGALFMDPRVKLVVTSYPSTSIERNHGPIQYPNLKFKSSNAMSGWWNVYLKIKINSEGIPVNTEVLRPETNGTMERQFLEQVRREVGKWTFDPKEAEIHVDVRFYVE